MTYRYIALLFITWSVFKPLTAELNQFSVESTPLFLTLQSVKQSLHEASNISAEGVSNLQDRAEKLMHAMQEIASMLNQTKNTGKESLLENFATICSTLHDISHLNFKDVRIIKSYVEQADIYLVKNRNHIPSNVVLTMYQFNRDFVSFIEDTVNQNCTFIDQMIDVGINQPLEFMSENKALSAVCIIGAIGVLMYSLRSVPQPIQQNQVALNLPNNNPLSVIRGDITLQRFNDNAHAAIVNAANTVMLGGGGVDGAIHQAAGPGLRQECAQFPVHNNQRCPIGEARITGGHNLAPLRIIHAVGPDTRVPAQNAQREALLSSVYRNCLDLALQNGIRRLAFPAISTAIYQYPLDEATQIAIATVQQYIQQYPNSFDEIRFIAFDQNTYNTYNRRLNAQ